VEGREETSKTDMRIHTTYARSMQNAALSRRQHIRSNQAGVFVQHVISWSPRVVLSRVRGPLLLSAWGSLLCHVGESCRATSQCVPMRQTTKARTHSHTNNTPYSMCNLRPQKQTPGHPRVGMMADALFKTPGSHSSDKM
jgi:hypothetical protein